MSERVPTASLKATIGRPPEQAFSELRQAGEVAWDPELKAWIASSYDACKHIFTRDEEAFHHHYQDFRDTPLGDVLGSKHLAILSGREHHELHHWFLRLFSPRAVDGWRETVIRPVIASLIDRFAAGGRAELFAQLANPLPPKVIASIMGLPTDDAWVGRVKHLMGVAFSGFPEAFAATDASVHDFIDTPRFAASMAAANELKAMLRPHIEARQEGTGDDAVSLLWRDGRQMFDDWTVDDMTALCRQMFQAGSDTTSHGLAGALRLLLDDLELQERVRGAGEKHLAAFVEEALRLHGPTVFRERVADCPVEVGGATIQAGEVVVVHQAAADRDPARYPSGDEVDLDRKAPRDHMAFIFGPRTCVGAALARAEIQEAVRMVLERLPGLRWDPDVEVPPVLTSGIRLEKKLPVVFG